MSNIIITQIALFCTIIAVWIAPLHPFFLIAGLAIAIDTFFGIKLAFKRKKASSRKFSRILYKLLVYNSIIVITYVVDFFILGDFVKIITPIHLGATKAVVLWILITELFSVDEKMRQINGKGFGFYWKKVSKIIKKVSDEKKNMDF